MKVIYLGLAGLMAVGLIGFGVGGLGGGGILNAVSEDSGSGTDSYTSEVAAAQKRTAKHPNEAAAWAALATAQLHEASEGEDYDQTTGRFTAKGKEELDKVSESWNRYLELDPNNQSSTLAAEIVRIYGSEGLNEPASAARALQIMIAAEPNREALYADLAKYSYEAHNEGQGELAMQKALALAPTKSDRKGLKAELEKIKEDAEAKAAEAAEATTTTSA